MSVSFFIQKTKCNQQWNKQTLETEFVFCFVGCWLKQLNIKTFSARNQQRITLNISQRSICSQIIIDEWNSNAYEISYEQFWIITKVIQILILHCELNCVSCWIILKVFQFISYWCLLSSYMLILDPKQARLCMDL